MSRMKFNELRKILQDNKNYLREKYNVDEIGIFGSYVKEKQRETSDIDILVGFKKPIDLLTFVNLKNYLSDVSLARTTK